MYFCYITIVLRLSVFLTRSLILEFIKVKTDIIYLFPHGMMDVESEDSSQYLISVGSVGPRRETPYAHRFTRKYVYVYNFLFVCLSSTHCLDGSSLFYFCLSHTLTLTICMFPSLPFYQSLTHYSTISLSPLLSISLPPLLSDRRWPVQLLSLVYFWRTARFNCLHLRGWITYHFQRHFALTPYREGVRHKMNFLQDFYVWWLGVSLSITLAGT